MKCLSMPHVQRLLNIRLTLAEHLLNIRLTFVEHGLAVGFGLFGLLFVVVPNRLPAQVQMFSLTYMCCLSDITVPAPACASLA